MHSFERRESCDPRIPIAARHSGLIGEDVCEGVIGRDGKLVDAAPMRLAANALHKARLMSIDAVTNGWADA